MLIEFFLLGEAGGIDGFEAGERLARVLEALGDGLVGEVAEAVIVARVADLGGELGRVLKGVFPFVVEEASQVGAAGCESGIWIGGLSDIGQQKKTGEGCE